MSTSDSSSSSSNSSCCSDGKHFGKPERGNSHHHGIVQDKSRWWAEVARDAYQAIDGSLEGFESAVPHSHASGNGLSAQETELIKVRGVVTACWHCIA
jgi:hypothetical protein